MSKTIKEICKKYDNDRTRMMDIVISVQAECGAVDSNAMDLIAKEVNSHRVEVESVVSFYSFLSEKPKGKVVIRLCNDVVDKIYGVEKIAKVFEKEIGVSFGQTTKDGKISLEYTPCIGMCDQAPAALVNDEVVTCLTSEKVSEIVSQLKSHGDPKKLVSSIGDGNNADELVHSMVCNNIRKKGEVVFAAFENGSSLKKALELSPEKIISNVKVSNLQGRGGAGLPTGMKWEFTRAAKGDKKFVICNADEGEPGTFKDRVILTEMADLIFEGMTIGGYVIGADTGLMYLRGEYAYLRAFLEKVLQDRRDKKLLGNNILGKEGFNFDIRIQMGSGAYICGEETALISSCEGLRGDPKTRPPFPAQEGYLGCPTTVNNVETFCCVSRIIEKGAEWFSGIGSEKSSGTKILSVSGDCKNAGIYEGPFGIKIKDLLKAVGAEDAQAVLVGGPSGQFISPREYEKTISNEDLGTGGSIVVFGPKADILKVANEYMEFFVEESCGYCTPCRVGNVLLKEGLERIINSRGEASDLDYLEELGATIKATSRCGLGQTSPNPILSTLKNLREKYEALLQKNDKKANLSFDIKNALKDSEEIAGRKSVIY